MIRRLLGLPRLERAVDVAHAWRDTAREQKRLARAWEELAEARAQEIVQLKLEYTCGAKRMIESFLIILDRPEDEERTRDALIAGLQDLSDEVARLEELIA